MEIVANVFVVLHLVGFASLFGGFMTQLSAKERRVNPAMLHGALTQLVTGVVLVGLLYARDLPVNNLKIGIKLGVLIAIGVLIFMYLKKKALPAGPFMAIGALTLANVVVAVFV